MSLIAPPCPPRLKTPWLRLSPTGAAPMTKPAAATKPIPPTTPSTRSDPGPIEGRVQSAPNGRPRIHDTAPHQARPTRLIGVLTDRPQTSLACVPRARSPGRLPALCVVLAGILPMIRPSAIYGQIFGGGKCKKSLILLARPERFERRPPRFEVWCSVQLSIVAAVALFVAIP
jgi:hypothetical protein